MIKLEDKYQGVFHSIEFMIGLVYKKNNQLIDRQAIKSLEALVKHYSALVSKSSLPELELDELEIDIYTRIVGSLDAKELTGNSDKTGAARKGLSNGFKDQTKEEIFLACLQQVEKSAKTWNRKNGQRGYLDFVINYIR